MGLSTGRRLLGLAILGVWLALLGLAMWMIQQIALVACITAISTLLAYMIQPAVLFLQRKQRIPRVAAISVVYLGIVIVTVLGMAYVLPVVFEQFQALWSNLVGYLRDLQSNIDATLQWVVERCPEFARPWVEKIDPEELRLENLGNMIQQALPASSMSHAFSGVVGGVKMAAGMLATMVLVPLFTFYILMDVERYHDAFLRLIPARYKTDVAELMHEIDAVLGRYIRGQVIVCFTVGASIALALNLVGLQYATLIGVFAGVVDIIPYVGVALGVLPAFLIALVHPLFFLKAFPGIVSAVLVVVLMETVHWLEGHIIAPTVVGHSVGLPPLVVMIALLAGAEIGGLMGMVLAIPTAAVLRVLCIFYIRQLEAADSEAYPMGYLAHGHHPEAPTHATLPLDRDKVAPLGPTRTIRLPGKEIPLPATNGGSDPDPSGDLSGLTAPAADLLEPRK